MAILNTLIVNGSSRYLQKAYFQDLQVSGTASLASLSLSGNLSVGGNATVSGTLGVTGEATFSNVAVFSKVGQSTATWNNPAMVVGGTPDQKHLELCNDTIQGKNNKNTTNNLYLNYYGSNVYLAGSKIYAMRDSTFVAPTANMVTVNAQDMNVTNNLRANHYDLQSVAQLGGSFYVSPTVKFPNSSTSLTVAKSDTTLTLTITDSSITSTTMAGIVWTANSRVKVSGTINGVVTGTMDGTITSINTSSHVLTLSVSGENSGNVVAGTYSASQFSDLSVMVYQRKDGSNDYRVGIWMNCYDMSNSSATIRIYGGTTALPNVMIGNLTNAGLGTVNNLTPTGWGLFAQNAFLHGSIVAKDGKIGGFTLSENWMYSSSNAPAANNLFIMPGGTSSQYTVGGNKTTGWVFTSGTTFGVTKAGGVYATSGQIGGFSIGSTKLSNGTLGSDSSLFMGTTNLGSAKIADNTTDAWRLTVGSHFGVTNTGAVYATSGKIGGWAIGATSLTSGTWGENNSVMLCIGTSGSKSIGGSGSISGWVIAAGSTFGVTKTGGLYSTNGKIGGFSIGATELSNGELGASNSVFLSSANLDSTTIAGETADNWRLTVGTYFGVKSDGSVYATSGKIGGFKITESSIENGTIGTANSVFISTGTSDEASIGGSASISGWAFTAGSTFGVTKSGNLYAGSGSIGGFILSNGALYTNSHSAWDTNSNGIYIGTSGLSGGKKGAWWFWNDGSARIGAMTLSSAGVLSVPAANISGQLAASQIAAGAITASKLSVTIGGNNLLKGSSERKTSSSTPWLWFYGSNPPVSGDKVTLQIKGYLGSSYTISNSGTNITGVSLTYNSSTHMYTGTFTMQGSSSTTFKVAPGSGSVYCDWIKLEYGEIPTAWSPSPDELAGFDIDSTSIHTAGVEVTSNNDNSIALSSVDFTRDINETSRSGLRFAIGDKFAVSGDGAIYSSSGVIGGFTIGAYRLSNGVIGSDASIFLGATNLPSATIAGVSKSTWRITAGSYFGVTGSGQMYCTSGKIGGFDIGSNTLSNGTSIGADGSMFIGSANMGSGTINGTTSTYWRLTVGKYFGVTGSTVYANKIVVTNLESSGLDASGDIKTLTSSGGQVSLKSGTDNGLSCKNKPSSGTSKEVRFLLNNGGNAGIYDVSNSRWALAYNVGDGSMASHSQIVVSSDERIKTIYKPLGDNHKNLFMALKPIEFSFIDRPDERHFGLGAQTTENSMNKLGFGSEYNLVTCLSCDNKDAYGRDKAYYINYTEALMLSVPVVQDHEKEIAELKTKIEELENKLSQLTQ